MQIISDQEFRRTRCIQINAQAPRGILQREEERDFMVQGKPLGIADLDMHVVAHLVGINNAH